jgi:hypothetical protein
MVKAAEKSLFWSKRTKSKLMAEQFEDFKFMAADFPSTVTGRRRSFVKRGD